MIKPRGDYINGKFIRRRHPDGELPSVDPGDSDVIIGDFPIHHDAPEEALGAARTALPTWSTTPPQARIAMLQKLRAELRNRSDELIALIATETGRPLWETRDEVQAMHTELDALLTSSLAELALSHPPPGDSLVSFKPVGVVVVITPYPQPALLMHLDAVGAMVAGCTVVCKPSEHTPATAQLYAEIVHEADLPRGVFNMVHGDAATGEVLATSARTDGVLFSGSERKGRRLIKRLAGDPGKLLRTLTSGRAAALVLDDARLDEAAYQVVIGGCTTTGQRCTSTKRVIVHRRIADNIITRLIQLLDQLKVGYATNPDSFMGPLVSARVMEDYLADLKRVGAHGGQELVHGAPLSSRRRGYYVTPSLFKLKPEEMIESCDREVTGPLLTLAVVDDLDQGVELVNSSPDGLLMSVFCRSERALSRVRALQNTALCLQNLPTTHHPARLPLQPSGTSSNGLATGTLTARTCSRVVVSIGRDDALDVTMLPPGLPRGF